LDRLNGPDVLRNVRLRGLGLRRRRALCVLRHRARECTTSLLVRGRSGRIAPGYNPAGCRSPDQGVAVPNVTVHDFRVLDRVLAETDPNAGDVVFLGARVDIAYPFLVIRRISGPGGVYIDALDIID